MSWKDEAMDDFENYQRKRAARRARELGRTAPEGTEWTFVKRPPPPADEDDLSRYYREKREAADPPDGWILTAVPRQGRAIPSAQPRERAQLHEVANWAEHGRGLQTAATGGLYAAGGYAMPEAGRKATAPARAGHLKVLGKGMAGAGIGLNALSEGARVRSEIDGGKPAGKAIAGATGRVASNAASSYVGGALGGAAVGFLGAGPVGAVVGGLAGAAGAGILSDKSGWDDRVGGAAETRWDELEDGRGRLRRFYNRPR